MKSPDTIIREAIQKYQPVKFVLMVSGGHDSITAAHVSATILKELFIPFVVYHGDTTIGIKKTQEYVKEICTLFGWELHIRRPPNKKDWYENIVAKYGFPGATKTSHQFMYRRLKERALRAFVTHECKSAPKKRENVLLCSGARQSESRIRMGYKEETHKDASKIWCSPIFYWSEENCCEYMAEHQIPRNPVKDKICISGECLCGCFTNKEEWNEIQREFPEDAQRIKDLHKIAIENGHPWGWASGPTEWKKEQAQKNQQKINFMCVGCEKKYESEIII